MNNELFVSLYNSLARKLAFDMQDTSAMRSVRIVQMALSQKSAPAILVEAISQGSAIYEGYYPLDEKSYLEALPRYGITRFNQSNTFNSQIENRLKRQFTGSLERHDGVCCMAGSLTLSVPPEDPQEDIFRLFYFMDVFAASLNVHPPPVNLEWYSTQQLTIGGKQDYEKQ